MIVISKREDLDKILQQTPFEFASSMIELEKDHINKDIYTVDKETEETVKKTVDYVQTALNEENSKYKAEGGKNLGDLLDAFIHNFGVEK